MGLQYNTKMRAFLRNFFLTLSVAAIATALAGLVDLHGQAGAAVRTFLPASILPAIDRVRPDARARIA
jgi:hypothetical protein